MSFNLRKKEVEYVTIKCACHDCKYKRPAMEHIESWECPDGHINYPEHGWNDGAVDWNYTTRWALKMIFLEACSNERKNK